MDGNIINQARPDIYFGIIYRKSFAAGPDEVPEQSVTFSVSEGRKNETYGRSLKEKHGMTG